jgi:hypothetical protein
MKGKSMEEEMVTITKKEYDQLLEDAEWLNYLEVAGVHNWEGFSYAAELQLEDQKENEKHT